MDSKILYYWVIGICLSQLIINISYGEMYPSLIYPAFSKFQRTKFLGKTDATKYTKQYAISYNRKDADEGLIKAKPKYNKNKHSFYRKYDRRNTYLKIDCIIISQKNEVDTIKVRYKHLFHPLTKRKAQYIIGQKFWNYPVTQNNFLRLGAPYSGRDLTELEVFFRNNLDTYYKTDDKKNISEMFLLFNRVSNKTNRVVHQSKVRLK